MSVQRALERLSNVYIPRQSEIARLEGLLAEARSELMVLARKGASGIAERHRVGDLMKSIAQLKAVARFRH
jgi:hypothetical protein